MRIRPIQPDELPVFAGAATHSEHVGAVHDYVFDLLIKGSMRTEWCYVAESRGRAIGRAAFWTLPKMSRPLDGFCSMFPGRPRALTRSGLTFCKRRFVLRVYSAWMNS